MLNSFFGDGVKDIKEAVDDGAVRVRWICGQRGMIGVEYIGLKQVTLAATLRYYANNPCYEPLLRTFGTNHCYKPLRRTLDLNPCY